MQYVMSHSILQSVCKGNYGGNCTVLTPKRKFLKYCTYCALFSIAELAQGIVPIPKNQYQSRMEVTPFVMSFCRILPGQILSLTNILVHLWAFR